MVVWNNFLGSLFGHNTMSKDGKKSSSTDLKYWFEMSNGFQNLQKMFSFWRNNLCIYLGMVD